MWLLNQSLFLNSKLPAFYISALSCTYLQPCGDVSWETVLRWFGCVTIIECPHHNLDRTACYSPGLFAARLRTCTASYCTKQLRLKQTQEKNDAIERWGKRRVCTGLPPESQSTLLCGGRENPRAPNGTTPARSPGCQPWMQCLT